MPLRVLPVLFIAIGLLATCSDDLEPATAAGVDATPQDGQAPKSDATSGADVPDLPDAGADPVDVLSPPDIPPKDTQQPPPELPAPPTDAGPPPTPDTKKPPQCAEGETGCSGEFVIGCVDGMWKHLESCAPDKCIDGSCDQPEAVYTAVVVFDQWNGQCSSFNAPGADITGAELIGILGVLSHWTDVVAELPAIDCSNDNDDATVTIGAPTSDQLSLGGGWVAGTFGGQALEPGTLVTIFEFDESVGGTAQPYAVYLATDLDCPSKPGAESECMIAVGEGLGTTTFEVP